MKISVSKQDLSKSLTKVNTVIGRGYLPILSSVFIEALDDGGVTLTASNLEVTVQCPTFCEVIEVGKACLPVKELRNIVKGLPRQAEVVIESVVEGDTFKATVVSGGVSYSVKGYDTDDYVESKKNPTDWHGIGGDDFISSLKSVSYAVSKEENRYFLNGVYFELSKDKTRFVATDGRRLAIQEYHPLSDADELFSAIVPIQAIDVAYKVFKKPDWIKFGFGDNQFTVTDSCDTIHSRLVDGEYPKFDQILAEPAGKQVTAEVSQLLAGIQQMMLVPYSAGASEKKETTIWADITNNQILLSAKSKNDGTEASVAISVECGFELNIAFEGKYMAEALASQRSDWVWIDFIADDAAITFTSPDGGGKVDLIMPKRRDK